MYLFRKSLLHAVAAVECNNTCCQYEKRIFKVSGGESQWLQSQNDFLGGIVSTYCSIAKECLTSKECPPPLKECPPLKELSTLYFWPNFHPEANFVCLMSALVEFWKGWPQASEVRNFVCYTLPKTPRPLCKFFYEAADFVSTYTRFKVLPVTLCTWSMMSLWCNRKQ